MSTPEYHVESRGAADFAEVAEAVGVATSDVVGAMIPNESKVLVLAIYTKGDRVFAVRLQRDADRILRKISEREILGGIEGLMQL